MTSPQSKVVVVDTMVASALVNARLDRSGAEQFKELISDRPIIVSFATVTELHFGAVKAHWGEFRLRSLDRDLEGFTVA